jgi:hypothetical protein
MPRETSAAIGELFRGFSGYVPEMVPPLFLLRPCHREPPAARQGGPSPPRPLPRSGGQFQPQSHAGASQLRPAYLRVRPHSSALFQGSHRTLPFERPAVDNLSKMGRHKEAADLLPDP